MKIENGVLVKVEKEDIINGVFEFPNEVTEIGDTAFMGCDNLSKIVIPEGITKIGMGAFGNCINLTEIVIPKGITEIEEQTFYGCNSLSKVVIPEGITKIGEGAFGSCFNLSEIIIPEGVTEIGVGAFEQCESLTEIVLPDSVTEIGGEAFKGSGLEEIIIPKGVTTISYCTFEDCDNLSKIVFLDEVFELEISAFSGCRSLEEIVMPKGKTIGTIGACAFVGCKSLEEFTIVTNKIEDNAFSGCTNLSKLTISEGVLIEEAAFSGCKSLSEIVIPRCVEISDNAFELCTNLSKIVMVDDVMKLEDLDYNNVEYDKDNNATILKKEPTSKSSKYIPLPYLIHLNTIMVNGKSIKNPNYGTFITDSDFRAFNSNIPDLKELLSDYSEQEQFDFFKFAVCLGCFSTEKIVDKNGKETEVTVGQKASALLAKLIKTPELEIGKYHSLFTSLPIETKVSQDFLDFLTPQGKKNEKIELLINLEKEYPGIFSKVMVNFEKAVEFRKTLAEDGTTKTVPWREALINFYLGEQYINVTPETRDIANLYSSKGIDECAYKRAVELRRQAKAESVPEHILGKEIRELSILEQIEELKKQTAHELANTQELIQNLYSRQFTYEWLNKNDPKNGILGLYVSCCGTITSIYYGKSIAESSITQRDVQNLVVRDSKGEIISKGTIYVDEEHGYAVFNDFELNQKYREHEHVSGIYQGDDKDESELSESERRQREERNLIFAAFQRGIQAFVEEYDLQHPDCPMQQINVGMGYNRLKRNVKQFEQATELLTVPSEYMFEDARKTQYVLYKRDDKKEKDNQNIQEER